MGKSNPCIHSFWPNQAHIKDFWALVKSGPLSIFQAVSAPLAIQEDPTPGDWLPKPPRVRTWTQPPDVRVNFRIVRKYTKRTGSSQVYVGCSGNTTIMRTGNGYGNKTIRVWETTDWKVDRPFWPVRWNIQNGLQRSARHLDMQQTCSD